MTLIIAEFFYPSGSLQFLFDNIISHSVYVKDVLYLTQFNKKVDGKQR